MSYILEALKKSDQQRQRGATPTLQVAQVTVAAPKRPLFIYYSLLAVILLGAGIMIGWLHPWQPEQMPPVSEAIAAETNISMQQQAAPAPIPALPELPGKTAQEFLKQNPAPAVQPVPVADAMKPSTPARASSGEAGAVSPMPDKSARPASVAQEQQALPVNELPVQIQQEIPAMTVQLHAYSSVPNERLASINSIRLREGESLMPGLRLEQITPDGMIFSYKGYRFQRGIR